MSKIIKYYRKSQYGTDRAFIHPENSGEATIIRQLTGQKTAEAKTRELIRDLTGGQIQWQEVVAP